MQPWEIKAAELAAKVAILVAANPKLLPVAGSGKNSRVIAAKNMRIELAAAFPGVKFSIKGREFSGGDAIDVSWIDGPQTAQVDAIIDKYAAGSFSGVDDSYTYSRSAWPAAFGDAKYIHSRRDYSDAAVEACIRQITTRYGANMAEAGVEPPTLEQWKYGRLSWTPILGNDGVRDLLCGALYKRTWALTKAQIARFAEAQDEGQPEATT